MLEHLGLAAEAARLQAAVARVYRDGKALTPDQRGTATTKQMAAAVLAATEIPDSAAPADSYPARALSAAAGVR